MLQTEKKKNNCEKKNRLPKCRTRGPKKENRSAVVSGYSQKGYDILNFRSVQEKKEGGFLLKFKHA